MTALQKRALKSKLVSHFERTGIRCCGTNSANIAIFSERPLNEKSVFWGNYGSSSYLTTFGPKEAESILRT